MATRTWPTTGFAGTTARRSLLPAVTLAALLAALLGAAWWWEQRHRDDHEVLFIIPRGTVIRQANGDGMMIPRRLTLTVGERDTLVVRNDDVWPAQVGPLRLGPGQSFRQRFRSPGTLDLVCATMYHEEQVQISILPGRRDPWALARWLARG